MGGVPVVLHVVGGHGGVGHPVVHHRVHGQGDRVSGQNLNKEMCFSAAVFVMILLPLVEEHQS